MDRAKQNAFSDTKSNHKNHIKSREISCLHIYGEFIRDSLAEIAPISAPNFRNCSFEYLRNFNFYAFLHICIDLTHPRASHKPVDGFNTLRKSTIWRNVAQLLERRRAQQSRRLTDGNSWTFELIKSNLRLVTGSAKRTHHKLNLRYLWYRDWWVHFESAAQ